jgi:hypothetical protein
MMDNHDRKFIGGMVAIVGAFIAFALVVAIARERHQQALRHACSDRGGSWQVTGREYSPPSYVTTGTTSMPVGGGMHDVYGCVEAKR